MLIRSLLLYTLLAPLPVFADSIRVIAVSPDAAWQVQLRQASGLVGGDPESIDIVNRRTGEITYSVETDRRSTDAGWSKNSEMLVINDHVATSGDFLYVFRIVRGHVIRLRSPSHDALEASLVKIHDRMQSDGRFTLTGVEWLSNSDLRAMVTGGGYGDDAGFTAIVHIDDMNQCTVVHKSLKSLPPE